MAKKKKQRAPVNPELTKVKSVFQRNVDMAYKVQRTHKSDFVEHYDLTDVYCKRRIKAVMNLLPKFKERYGKQYPELEMEEDLTNVKAKDQSCKAFWLNNSGLFVGACATAPFPYFEQGRAFYFRFLRMPSSSTAVTIANQSRIEA